MCVGFEPIPPTSEAQLDATVAALQSKAAEWVGTSPQGRAALLRACLSTTLAVAEEAAAAGTDAKGSWGQGVGEELVVWVSLVVAATGAPAGSAAHSTACVVLLPSFARVPPLHSVAMYHHMHTCTHAHALQVPVVSGLREYAEALEAGGAPKPNSVRRRPDGQVVADVFPAGMEALLYGGFRGEAWIQPGKEPTQVGRC